VEQDLGISQVSFDLLKAKVEKIRTGEGTGCEIPAVLGIMSIKVSVSAGMMDVEIKRGKDVTTCMSKVHLSNLGF
jgi:hypothetical protein